jgi:hypothetical protein
LPHAQRHFGTSIPLYPVLFDSLQYFTSCA